MNLLNCLYLGKISLGLSHATMALRSTAFIPFLIKRKNIFVYSMKYFSCNHLQKKQKLQKLFMNYDQSDVTNCGI